MAEQNHRCHPLLPSLFWLKVEKDPVFRSYLVTSICLANHIWIRYQILNVAVLPCWISNLVNRIQNVGSSSDTPALVHPPDTTLLRSTLLWFRTKKCLKFNPNIRPSSPSTFKYLQVPGEVPDRYNLQLTAELWSDKSLLGSSGLCQRWPPFSSKFAPRLWQPSSYLSFKFSP